MKNVSKVSLLSKHGSQYSRRSSSSISHLVKKYQECENNTEYAYDS